MSEWVAVVLEEGDEPIEIPAEPTGAILLTSVTAQFPDVTGLKFRNPDTNNFRAVRCHDDQLFPPTDEGWGNLTYVCVRPKKDEPALKRKSENDAGQMSSKNQRIEDMMDAGDSVGATSDLIVLGLPFKTTEDDVREYFSSFGELAMCQLKLNVGTNSSRGYAFIRFTEKEVQDKVLLQRHLIQERWCDVKVPDSQQLKINKQAVSCKVFVGGITEGITADDLKEHFETFGAVTDIYVPKPFRSFAFVNFVESKVAMSLLGKEHVIKGVTVNIGSAQPKVPAAGRLNAPPTHPDFPFGPHHASRGGRDMYGHGGYGGGYRSGAAQPSPWASQPGYGGYNNRGSPRYY